MWRNIWYIQVESKYKETRHAPLETGGRDSAKTGEGGWASWTAQALFAWTRTHDEPWKSETFGYIAAGLLCADVSFTHCALAQIWDVGAKALHGNNRLFDACFRVFARCAKKKIFNSFTSFSRWKWFILFGFFSNLWVWDVCLGSEPFCSSPLCFSRHVSGFFFISTKPWLICSASRSTLQSNICIFRVFQHVRPAGFFFSCSVSGSFLSLFPALQFTPATTCTRSSLIFVHPFLFSFIFISIYFLLLSPSMLSFRPHARTLCQLWYKLLYPTRAPPLFLTEAHLLNRSVSDEWRFSRWNWEWYKSKWLCLFNCSS